MLALPDSLMKAMWSIRGRRVMEKQGHRAEERCFDVISSHPLWMLRGRRSFSTRAHPFSRAEPPHLHNQHSHLLDTCAVSPSNGSMSTRADNRNGYHRSPIEHRERQRIGAIEVEPPRPASLIGWREMHEGTRKQIQNIVRALSLQRGQRAARPDAVDRRTGWHVASGWIAPPHTGQGLLSPRCHLTHKLPLVHFGGSRPACQF